ncbi:MAG: 16S rRNA (guanine(966)-N(2))-methyltransferase RsmD [Candidatus Omnitrophica bacterium]|nr:16S rRNA (guanine(966)-N(2))-methyltransferase RsmD [Candidatus Omnitrophota bacterium]
MKKGKFGLLRIIAGEDRGRRLISPPDDRIRPTPGMAREAIGSMLQEIIPGCQFLDLYAGTGSVGLEALSRGAGKVTLVENDRDALALLRQNVRLMTRASDCIIAASTAAEQCREFARQKKQFDLVFVDPPYDVPGVPLRHLEGLLAPGGFLIHQRPEKFPPGDPFRGTSLVQFDQRRYGKADLTFWKFPDKTEETPSS